MRNCVEFVGYVIILKMIRGMVWEYIIKSFMVIQKSYVL